MDRPTSRKKSHLESGLNQRDREKSAAPHMETAKSFVKTAESPMSWAALALKRALQRMAGLVFLLVFWVLAGACQRHGVGGFLLRNSSSSYVVGCVLQPSSTPPRGVLTQ